MDRPASIVVTLRVAPGSDPIAGELDQAGQVCGFTGWLEFTRALERALTGLGPDRSTADRRPVAS